MENELKDYLHLYLGCEVMTPTGQGKLFQCSYELDMAGVVYGIMGPDFERWENISDIKPILRPLSTLNEEDFYSFFRRETETDILVKATVNRFWCAGYYDKKEYQERIDEELPIDAETLIWDLEEADHTNVFSTTKQGDIAHGCGDELRYFIDVKTLSAWISHLRKRGIDTDGLIKSGLAIDSTSLTIKPTT